MTRWRNSFAFALHREDDSRWSEAKLILGSFLIILLIGTIFLVQPSSHNGEVSFINALFTATSAICVTGLGVVDTGTAFTLQGQIFLIMLMEIGGLGQMTMTLLLIAIFSKRVGLRQQVLAKEALGQEGSVNIIQLVKRIVLFAFIAQLIGTGLMAIRWVPEMGWSRGLYVSFFHAVSAFNNAGFSLFANNLISYRDDPLICLTIAGLLILGGIGFTVIVDLVRNRRWRKLKLHSKLMILMTPALLLLGTVIFWLLERNNPGTFGNAGIGGQLLAAFFQSASARTAGFNSIDIGQMVPASLLFMMMLMFIGAGATSTGGGIKVTTFAVVLLATKAFLTKRPHVTAFGRTLSPQIVTRSLAIIIVSTMVLMLAMFLLMITDALPFDKIMFETISAFATVGLSTGITPSLSGPGKFILVLVMICGRLGPLTLAFMLARPSETRIKYPEESVYTG
ncbi:Ktr system potassium transporter B [Aeromonas jandaei]|uniref:Ktr system potassium transporter B n=1 Tax=Aeromonas jandaei TaxID=650 RepID=A0ABD7EJS4_AERJA|nr:MULTISPECIES: TrkH family potassium uptake protein [Aeromonas]BBQ51324.1 Ktr system potassium transporter B [Aeromonas veronii]KIQ80891.1 Ktr system potassium transporter B [Aeromonas sp. L_1B5_3]MBL0599392.1 Ktr system potassium transporter B [Aeromonas jandaei]QSR72114.1 Ktr system potassium transporter B [Aeromonas jandaei]QTL95948.1 Ktr system potassium uptake protein B [Aeromonas jandaei]